MLQSILALIWTRVCSIRSAWLATEPGRTSGLNHSFVFPLLWNSLVPSKGSFRSLNFLYFLHQKEVRRNFYCKVAFSSLYLSLFFICLTHTRSLSLFIFFNKNNRHIKNIQTILTISGKQIIQHIEVYIKKLFKTYHSFSKFSGKELNTTKTEDR